MDREAKQEAPVGTIPPAARGPQHPESSGQTFRCLLLGLVNSFIARSETLQEM